ncbi:MAG TPA: molybdenum cofactor biosynthesis protein MoaE [Acidisarcina sp.]|nr:molybdenum cofactor biosynthesis protein MoaE [Acidisarcina sp.]
MQVRVLYFGALKDVFHREGEAVSLPAGATVRTLLDHYRSVAPEQGGFWNSLAVAVNQEYARADQALAEDDEIALLPPVSGGSGLPGGSGLSGGSGRGLHVALVREPIDTAALAQALRQGEDGAVVVFDGIVRNHTRGRRTLHLVYEAYEAMAIEQMRKLAAEACERFAIRDVTVVHRLGQLGVGETSVVIVVASAHRAAAFDACRWLIDTLKSTVPIWKKEFFEDGAVWVAGEPFPDSIVPGQIKSQPSGAMSE